MKFDTQKHGYKSKLCCEFRIKIMSNVRATIFDIRGSFENDKYNDPIFFFLNTCVILIITSTKFKDVCCSIVPPKVCYDASSVVAK